LVRLVRRDAFITLVAAFLAGCSLTFDADELTSGAGGSATAAGRAGSGGFAGVSGSSATGGKSGSAAATAGASGRGGSAGSSGSAGTSGASAGGTTGAGAGGSSGKAFAGSGGSTSGAGGALGARRIFWVEQGSDTVNAVDSDGSSSDLLIDIGASSYLRSIAVDPQNSRLYYSDDQQSRIERASFTGANRGNVISSLDKPVGIDIDVANGKLYFADQGETPGIFRVNVDGSELEPLITTGVEHPYGVALDLDAGRIYLVDNGVNAVFRANLDGSALTNLNVPDVDLPIQISLDLSAGKFYWSEIGAVKRIRRANLDGSAAEVIVSRATFSNFSQALGIKVDALAHALYFIDGNAIRRSNLDGSGVTTVLSDLDGPVGLALAY
jgi:low density lipoprotein receptor-related protein 5/6